MAATAQVKLKPLARPYTRGTFRHRLKQFEELIKEITLQDVDGTPEERRKLIAENLHFDEFCASIRALFDKDIKSQDIKNIFQKISTNPDGKFDWSELFGYSPSLATQEEQGNSWNENSSNVFAVSSRKRIGEACGDRKRRDVAVGIRYIAPLDCYATVSQRGCLCIWTNKFRLQSCSDVCDKSWVTGCDYLPNIRKLAVSTERNVCLLDTRSNGSQQTSYMIQLMDNSIQCLAYVPMNHDTMGSHRDTMLFGDEVGYVGLLTVDAVDISSNRPTENERTKSSTVKLDPMKLTCPVRRRRLHTSWVSSVKYFPQIRSFGSCSSSSTSSFILESIDAILDDRPVKGLSIHKGVNAFDYCPSANVVATGGVDKIIRLWHPNIMSSPTAKMIGHLFTIVDLVINDRDQHLISLSTARVIRVWDLQTLTGLQVFMQNNDITGEKRIYSMHFNAKYEYLITGSSVLDVWPMTRAIQDSNQTLQSHDKPVTQALYNGILNQVVTACTGSTIKVWHAETGRLNYSLPLSHGQHIDVTALALNSSGYRLASGGIDGSVKVWDFVSGQELKAKKGRKSDDDLMSVVMLKYVEWSSGPGCCIVAIGWKNRVLLFSDANRSHDLIILRHFDDSFPIQKNLTSSIDSSGAIRSKYAILPRIDDAGLSSRSTSSLNKEEMTQDTRHDIEMESVLARDDMTCGSVAVIDKNNVVLATGCTNGGIVLWNVKESTVMHIGRLTNSSNQTMTSQRSSSVNGKGVLSICFHAFVEQEEPLPALPPSDPSSPPPKIVIDQPTIVDDAIEPAASYRDDDVDRRQSDVTIPEINDDDVNHGNDDVITHEVRVDVPKKEGTTKLQPENVGKAETGTIKEAEKVVHNFIITSHTDSVIRIWDLQCRLIAEITAPHSSPITAMCSNSTGSLLFTADQMGYLVANTFKLNKTGAEPEVEEILEPVLEQMVSWRGHLSKVTQLSYDDNSQAVFSASIDGSVRIWHSNTGQYIGYLGQTRPLSYNPSPEVVLPGDIHETPTTSVKPIRADKTPNQQKLSRSMEYPLKFDNERWKPLLRSAYVRKRNSDPVTTTAKVVASDPVTKSADSAKFFNALIKPRPWLNVLDSYVTGEKDQGAVYRALPVYRVKTPPRVTTPSFSFPKTNEDQAFLFENESPAVDDGLTPEADKPSPRKKNKRKYLGSNHHKA